MTAVLVDNTATYTAQSVDFIDPFTVDRMRRGTLIWVRVVNTTIDYIGTTTNVYKIVVDMACKINKPLKIKDVDGSLLGVEWQMGIQYDSTAAKAYQVQLQCATPYV